MHLPIKLVVVIIVVLIAAFMVLAVFSSGLGGFSNIYGGLECKAKCGQVCIGKTDGSSQTVEGCPTYSCICGFDISNTRN